MTDAITAPAAQITTEAPKRAGFDRAAVRALTRRLVSGVDGCKAVSQCGLPISAAVAGPGLILTENGRMVGGQVVACRSPMRCAWCSPMQWRLAEEIGVEYMRRHEDAGGWVAATTFTVPHRRSDRLADTTAALFATWAGIRKHRPIVRAKTAAGVVTSLSVLHVKWSPENGWHPHLHVAWLCTGDIGRADHLVETLQSGWMVRAESVTGRPASPSGSHGTVVFTSVGFWKYCKPDDPFHPKNDCLHPDHSGCGMCTIVGDPLDGSGPIDPGPIEESSPVGSLEVLSGVGMLAVGGSSLHQAVLAEYVESMAGIRRVPSTFREAAKAYGHVAPPDPWSTPGEGGPRVWVHPSLAAAVELRRQPGGPTLDWGIANAVKNPDGTARAWSDHLGRPVDVVTHPNDGAPVLGFPDDLDGSSPSMQAAQGGHIMSNTESKIRDSKMALAAMLVTRMAKEADHRKDLLDAVDDDGKDRVKAGNRAAAEKIHTMVLGIKDPGLSADYESALHAYIESVGGFPGRVISMAVEVNESREEAAKPPKPSANGAVPVPVSK